MNSKYRYCYLLIAMIFCLSGQVYGAASHVKNITKDKKFTLTAIHFNQVGLIDSFDFYPIYEQFLGARVRVSTLKKICNEITQLYQAKGFSAAKCTIPVQSIKSGVVKIHIVEGLVGRVRLTGEMKETDDLLMSYVNQIPLNQPLDETQLNYVSL
jgi:hemolysin activation/secretion protein